jgi:hypothetical protein
MPDSAAAQLARCFSDDFDTARNRFLSACERIGLRVSAYPARIRRDSGDPLVCDVARLGSPDATRVAVLCSAAGGMAGLVGCGAALGVMTQDGYKDLPRDVALVLVHACNPAGPIWPYFSPNDPMADPSADGPAPDWSDGVLAAAERRFKDFQRTEGFDWNRLAGRTLASMSPPAWDGATLRAIAADRLRGAERVCVIDVRTGPGQFGAREIVPCDPPGSAGRARAERWFTVDIARDSAAIGAGNAPCGGGLGGLAKGAVSTNVVLEVGTYSMGGLLSRGATRESAGYPADPTWRAGAWSATRETLGRAYRGLIHDL